MNDLIRKTFTDKDGSLSIPEIVAACGAVPGIGGPVWDWAVRGSHFDLQSYGIGLGALILALGTAQRIRDGLWKKDEQ